MLPQKLTNTRLKGTLTSVAESYGEEFRHTIRGFCSQEIKGHEKRTAYARRCLAVMERETPRAVRWLRGMSRGADQPLDLMVLLSLHEELVHIEVGHPHCTAVAACGARSTRGRSFLAQTWDWPPHLYPWPGLLTMAAKGLPRMVTYHFPGLWSCCGVNEHGLSLLWTGGGYSPLVPPRVGNATYALIFDLLCRRSVDEAVAYLERVRRAGSFMFFLGDAQGATALIEAVPQRLHVEHGDLLYRPNLFGSKPIVAASKQVKPSRAKHHSVLRLEALEKILPSTERHSVGSLKRAVSSEPIFVDLGMRSLTIDRFVIDCQARTLHTARGGNAAQGPWQTVTV